MCIEDGFIVEEPGWHMAQASATSRISCCGVAIWTAGGQNRAAQLPSAATAPDALAAMVAPVREEPGGRGTRNGCPSSASVFGRIFGFLWMHTSSLLACSSYSPIRLCIITAHAKRVKVSTKPTSWSADSNATTQKHPRLSEDLSHAYRCSRRTITSVYAYAIYGSSYGANGN